MRPESEQATAPRVSQEEAQRLFDQNAALFVDVRDRTAYARAHVPGAASIPLNELARRMSEIPRDRKVITY